jgi:hypothetical protein
MSPGTPGDEGRNDQSQESTPNKVKTERHEWSVADKRLLGITFMGGLLANVGLALIVGLAFILIQLIAKGTNLDTILFYIFVGLIIISATFIFAYIQPRLLPHINFFSGFLWGVGTALFLTLFAYAVYVSK